MEICPFVTCYLEKKVFNKAEKLFCTVAAICNLVQEFNGLVSTKGSASAGPLVFKEF